jgi:DNA-binding IclR family transcriptional regulator
MSKGNEPLKNYSKTFGVTQALRKDIIEFLCAKHTANATLELAEVMSLYNCPEGRARRVINSLVNDGVLSVASKDSYKVTI